MRVGKQFILYTGTFVKDEKSVEVTATTGWMLFCNAIIELYGLGVELTEDKPVKTIRQQMTKTQEPFLGLFSFRG